MSDEDIREGIRLLAETTGIFTETAGGVTIAVLAKLARRRDIDPSERVVAYLTGEAALALGDADAALTDLTIAVETNEKMGALPWLAQARDAITRAQQCAGLER